MFQGIGWCFKNVMRVTQLCFKNVVRVFPWKVDSVSREIYRCFKGVSKTFQRSPKGVSKKFQRCSRGRFESVSRRFQGSVNKACFKEILVSSVFQSVLINVSWVIHGCFKDVSRKLQGYLKSSINVLKMFQASPKGVSGKFQDVSIVFKRCFMLHGTHRSYPSRRWAC